jgi:hypothetical protein
MSVASRGELPREARLAPPLPFGVVVVRPATPAQGLRLDLTAPFGYTLPGGRILPPTLTYPPRVPFEEAVRAGAAARAGDWTLLRRLRPTVDVQGLAPCQVRVAGRARPACTLSGTDG